LGKSDILDCARIRGFNYQPSYGRYGVELWDKFDAAAIDHELGIGKRHFPGMNAIRFWLSFEAFGYGSDAERSRFLENFERVLQIADGHGLGVMPVLFNRWHDGVPEYGGVFIDHFLPGSNWVGRRFADLYKEYVPAVVGNHADDPRIFGWDLCNEPFSYDKHPDEFPEIRDAEYAWLKDVYDRCKELGAVAPISVGIPTSTLLELADPISDVLNFHAYDNIPRDQFETLLDDAVALSERVQKPLLVTETCWGSLDDATRSEVVSYTLGELRKRNIGWLAYVLHHSLVADCHRPEFGPVANPGNLAFIEADGSLRPGHDVFNEF